MKRLKLPRLLQTTALRLALRYALAYAAILGLAFAVWLWATSHYRDAQAEAKLEQELVSLLGAFDNSGSRRMVEGIVQRLAGAQEEGRVYLLVGADGKKRAGNLLSWPTMTAIAYDGKVRRVWIEGEVIPREIYGDDAYWPVVARQFPDGSRLLLAHRVPQAKELQDITDYLTQVLGVAVLLALVMGVNLGRTILGRMDTIGRTAEQIIAGDLSKRVPVSAKGDEFDALAQRLNSMLDRIQQLIRGMREVSDNVAHDLRSPLTRLRNRLEVTLLEQRSEGDYRQALSEGIEHADGLIKTFNALLGIAQAEAGSLRAQWHTVDLARLAHDLVEFYGVVAEEKGQTLEVIDGERAEIIASRDLLGQALGNLVDNAIKYTPAGGTIRVRVSAAEGKAQISVSDNGPGIPLQDRERVLERFVRLDSARHTSGNGLGLPLVQAVARLHGAELILLDANPGFVVTLRFDKQRTAEP